MMSIMAPGQEGARVEGAILAYQVFLDGREKPLRNAELVELSLSSFKDILAAGKDATAYTAPFRAPNPNPFGGMMMFDFAFGDIPGPLVSLVVHSLLFEDVSIRKPSGEFPNLRCRRARRSRIRGWSKTVLERHTTSNDPALREQEPTHCPLEGAG